MVLELSKVVVVDGKSRETRTSGLAGITLNLHSKVEDLYFRDFTALMRMVFMWLTAEEEVKTW